MSCWCWSIVSRCNIDCHPPPRSSVAARRARASAFGARAFVRARVRSCARPFVRAPVHARARACACALVLALACSCAFDPGGNCAKRKNQSHHPSFPHHVQLLLRKQLHEPVR